LSPNKLNDVRVLIGKWSTKKRATKKDLQHLIGKLNWCARVVTGGRTFMRNLINCMCQVKQSNYHVRLTKSARADIAWWKIGLDIFHGTTSFTCDAPLPSSFFSTDACSTGAGGHFGLNWFFVSWLHDMPEMSDKHINLQELKTVEIAAELWSHDWHGKHIVVSSDNAATVACINKGTTRSVDLLDTVHKLFWLSVKNNFKLSAKFIPGKLNILSDRLSRMFDPLAALEAQLLLSGVCDPPLECVGAMSYDTFLYLQECWETA